MGEEKQMTLENNILAIIEIGELFTPHYINTLLEDGKTSLPKEDPLLKKGSSTSVLLAFLHLL